MSILYPLCLLGLLGIPAVIIIYILKSQYTEQTVNSTYIWTLSEKFLKKRNPLNGLTGLIALLLQLLMIVLITLALINPLFILKDKADQYCFVLDASESMNMKDGKETRFERAKEEIEKIISSSTKGSEYTLIYASNDTTTVFEDIKDKKNAIALLNELEPSYVESSTVDTMGLAQEVFQRKPATKTYLVTDKSYSMHQNVEIINVAQGGNNVGISGVNCNVKTSEDGTVKLHVDGLVTSYKSNATVKLKLYVDDIYTGISMPYMIRGGEELAFTLPPYTLSVPSYSSVRIAIDDEDVLAADSEYIHYNIKNEKQYKTIIVSETPFFFQAAFESVGDYDVTAVTPGEYEDSYKNKSYGLYIFDSYTPDTLPTNGSVWMIDSKKSLENTGFNYRSEVKLEERVYLEKSTSSQSTVKSLLEGVNTKDLYVINYSRYSTYGDYMTLFSCDGVPMIMAGENSYGNRMVVFAFNLHDSNLAITGDYINLMSNLIDYSFPSVLDKTTYVAGEEIIVNTVANCESVKVLSPLGNVKYLDTSRTMNTVVLDEIGTYTVEVNAGGSLRTHKLFSEAPLSERNPSVTEPNFSIVGQPSKDRLDGEFNPSIIIYILIVIIFAADWVVYMYEKRQLR